MITISIRAATGLALASLAFAPVTAPAAGSETPAMAQPAPAKEPTLEEKAAQRFPQPVRVSNLIGLPILDENSSIMGRVRAVVRTREGKVQLLMPLGGLFRFGERLVPIPVERVAMLGAQVAVVDMPPDRFQKSPTWYGSDSEPLAASDIIRVGVINR